MIPGIERYPHLQRQMEMDIIRAGGPKCAKCDLSTIRRKYAQKVRRANQRYAHDRKKAPQR